MSSPLPAELSSFPVTISLPLQWGDQDAFGHVNNTVFFRWFESARLAYLDRTGLTEMFQQDHVGPILAAISCNFRRQMKFPDRVLVGAKITRIGRTSLTMTHGLWSETHQALAADGESSIVVFDYVTQRPHAVPPAVRAAISGLEGVTF